jgi:hypothetical protein
LAVLSLALFGATAQANLLDDGGFENSALGAGADTNSNWVVVNESIGVTATGAPEMTSEFRKSPYAVQDGSRGMWYRPQVGVEGGELADASVSQDVVAPNNGSYELSFYAMHEAWHVESAVVSLSSSGGGSASIDLYQESLNGNFAAGVFGGPRDPFILTLGGVSAGDTLTVSSAMVGGYKQIPGPAGQSWAVDSFVLTSVIPEPTSIALASLGLLGVLAVRRRRQA